MRLIRQLTWMWALVCGISVAATGQTVFVDPADKIVTDTSPFTLEVKISNVTRLHGATIQFSFDATLLTCTAVSAGSFLPGVLALGPYPDLAPGQGTYTFDQAILSSTVVSGSGTLLTITFQGIKPGLSPITLVSVTLRGDPNNIHPTNPNDPIPCTTTNGQVTLEASVPITLSSFTASSSLAGDNVLLKWTTISEINNYGFWIQRRPAGEADFADLANSFTPGHGTTIQPQEYGFVDESVPASGEYEYRLRQVDLDGTDHFSNSVRIPVVVTAINETTPLKFSLEQNYPNPFNPTTDMRFQISEYGRVTLKVFDLLGREVSTLIDGDLSPGTYHRTFEAHGLPSGMYLYRLQEGDKMDIKKMLLTK